MNFKDSILESVFEDFKWSRNNTIELFEEAEKNNILNYPLQQKNSPFTFQSIIFQFQCIIATTDTYYRRITNHKNKSYGILVRENTIIKSKEIQPEEIKGLLDDQLKQLQSALASFDEKQTDIHIKKIVTIGNHEYLHQGQLILMFRSAGVELPQRFKHAWAL